MGRGPRGALPSRSSTRTADTCAGRGLGLLCARTGTYGGCEAAFVSATLPLRPANWGSQRPAFGPRAHHRRSLSRSTTGTPLSMRRQRSRHTARTAWSGVLRTRLSWPAAALRDTAHIGRAHRPPHRRRNPDIWETRCRSLLLPRISCRRKADRNGTAGSASCSRLRSGRRAFCSAHSSTSPAASSAAARQAPAL